MKITLPAKLALLLTVASPFVFADACSDKAGQEISALTFEYECPRKSSLDVDGEVCIIERKARAGQAEFICVEVAGQWLGGPWVYTGGKSVTLDELPELSDDIPFSEFANNNYGDDAAAEAAQANFNVRRGFIDTRTSLFNMNSNLEKIYTGIRQTFTDVREARNASFEAKIASVNNLQSTLNAESAALSAAAQANETRDVVVSQSNLMRDMIFQGFNDNVELHTITHGYVDKIPAMAIAVENGRYHAQNAFHAASEANNNALEAFYAAGNAEQATYEVLEAALDTKELTRDVRNLSEDILQTLEDGSGAGGTVDMSDTNDLLDDIRMDAKSASISADIQRQAITDQLTSVTDTLNNNAQGLSMQLGQQLSGIQSAIESGSGGGGGTDDDTETNEKLDGLGEKLDGIKGALDGFSDTTGMSSQLNDSVTNTNAELSTEMDTMFEGFGTEEKMSQLESTVSGMVNDSGLSDYDSIDKVRDSLSEATTISQIFSVSRATCAPYQFWTKEINFCPAAEKSSMVLEYFIWALTAIFAFLHITGFLSKLRTE